MKILFMGTPDIARDCLKAVYEAGHDIVGVVTVPDKPNTRNKKIIFSEVKEFALSHNLKLMQPEKLKDNEEFKKEVESLNPDILCIVAYGKYLPKAYLSMCKYEPINIHPSLLPKYRGPAPIQWAVLNGDKETGVTSMYISEKMDAGDIILQKSVQIGEYETTGELWDRLSKIGGELLVETLKQIELGIAPRIPQGDNCTEVSMISKEMAKIDFEKSAEADNTFSKYYLGKLYYWGDGVEKNNEKAEEYKKLVLGKPIYGNQEAGLEEFYSIYDFEGRTKEYVGELQNKVLSEYKNLFGKELSL